MIIKYIKYFKSIDKNQLKKTSTKTTFSSADNNLCQKSSSQDVIDNNSNDKFLKIIENFNNRPIYKELTAKIINSTSDDDLLQTIFDNLIEKLPTRIRKEYKTIMAWNKSRQAIYIIWILEAEVNNGGFNQFYSNPSKIFYKHLPEALQLVGATHLAKLTQQANDIYTNKAITKHQNQTLEEFSKSYDDNPLNDLDNLFYELSISKDLRQKQIKYIRKYKNDFID